MLMEKSKFPYNCIEIKLNENDYKNKKENFLLLKAMTEITSKNTDECSKINIEIKEYKKKLFYFLHDLFLDHIFLGNDLNYVTDLDIIWDIKSRKFYLKCIYSFFE